MANLNKIKVYFKEQIVIESPRELSLTILNELTSYTMTPSIGYVIYNIDPMPYNSFVLACLILKTRSIFEIEEPVLEQLKTLASSVCKPKAFIQNDGYVGIHIPSIPAYNKLMAVLGAKHARLTLWTVPFSRLYEAYRLISVYRHPFLPPVEISQDLFDYTHQSISENDTMEDLFKITLPELISVQKGWQIKLDGFEKLKYNNAADLLLRRPRRYEDRRNVILFKTAPFGKPALFKGSIVSFTSTFNNSCSMELNDGSETFEINFWGNGYLTKVYRPGSIVYVEATKIGRQKANGTKIIPIEEVESLPVVPVYRQAPSSKITTKVLTNCVDELLMRFKGAELANYITRDDKPLWELLNDLHFPKDVNSYYQTLDRLAYIELFYMQLLFIDKKRNEIKAPGIAKSDRKTKWVEEAISKLPYKLTEEGFGQKQALQTIFSRLRSSEAADILLSADVGAGKTTCAVAACLYTAECGYQSVLAGPTEILAKQLYENMIKFISPLQEKPSVAYLSGNTKAAEKKEILRGLRDGSIDILVGTHGVFNAEYKNLGLIVIDEQQKFGREQREMLLHSRKDGKKPDLLCQTATPIPQTTALAFYGDIDLITITTKPGNRKENITEWIKASTDDFLADKNSKYWRHIFREIENGRQVFIVTPAVEESAKSASVKKVEKIIESQFKGKIKIDTVHGGIKKETQNKKLQDFRDKKYDVLIASTVIEVGIDIPNATIMLVLDAEKFGASSLHQIRGRVGRSGHQGYCYLVSEKNNDSTNRRLGSLVDSNDGFQIALVDLQTRKEGDLFGSRQSGESSLMFCDLADHTTLIENAKYEAERLYDTPLREQALKDAKAFLRYKLEE